MAQAFTQFTFRRDAGQDRLGGAHHPVVIVGAGPSPVTPLSDASLQLAQGETLVLNDACARTARGFMLLDVDNVTPARENGCIPGLQIGDGASLRDAVAAAVAQITGGAA